MTVDIQSSNYPETLRENQQWVNQQLTWNKAKNKYDKKPKNSRSGMPCKWSNPETWSSVEDAETLYGNDPDAVPAYIITQNDNLVCIDLDHCCDSDGNLLPYAEYLVDLFQSYSERSVSGDGVHIFVNGSSDLKGDATIIYDGEEHQIEVFSAGKIIALTGDLINPDYADIEDGDLELEQLAAMVKPKPKPAVVVGQGNATSSLSPDHELRKVEDALQSVSSSSHSDWLSCGMALRLYGAQNGCEKEAWQVFDDWSKTTETGNYDAEQNLAAWNGWDTTETGSQVTLGTVYHKARENGWTFDGRSLTSADNGKKGGAPSLQHADTARDFFRETMVDEESGYPTVRYRDGKWYGYGSEGWSSIPSERILSCIATFMQNDSMLEDRCSGNYFRSVRDNLTSFNLCATTCTMPSWLDTEESADHWMAFSDGTAVNMLQWARVKAGLDTDVDEAEYKRPVSPAFFSKSFVDYPLETGDRSMPLFRQYLDRVQPDAQNRKMLQQMAGLMLCDETRYESAFSLIGSGANGKTVFLDVLSALIGLQNVSTVDLHTLDQRFQTFPLAECKLNICGEMPTDIGIGNLHKVEGILKHCISGGQIEVELKGVNKTTANCRARFAFATNSMPTFVDKSEGIWRRLRVINFPVTIPKPERDVNLAKKIIESELPAILLWALEGLADIVSTGEVYESEASLAMKNQHQLDSDREKSFLIEMCRVRHETFVSRQELYDAYKEWCQSNGRSFPLSKIKFLKRVLEIYPMLEGKQLRCDTSLQRTWCVWGLCLIRDGEVSDTDPYFLLEEVERQTKEDLLRLT